MEQLDVLQADQVSLMENQLPAVLGRMLVDLMAACVDHVLDDPVQYTEHACAEVVQLVATGEVVQLDVTVEVEQQVDADLLAEATEDYPL